MTFFRYETNKLSLNKLCYFVNCVYYLREKKCHQFQVFILQIVNWVNSSKFSKISLSPLPKKKLYRQFGCSTTLKYNLSIAQKNIVKIILSKPKTFSYKELFKLFRVPTRTWNLYKKQAICFISKTKAFKIKNNLHNLRKHISKIHLLTRRKPLIHWLKLV